MSALPSFQESALMQSLRAAFAAQSKPTAAQTKAWDAFNKMGPPGLRDEQWKYTQLHRLYSQTFSSHPMTPAVTAPAGITVSRIASNASASTLPFVLLNQALNAEELLIEVPDNTVVNEPATLEFVSAAAFVAPRVTIKLGRNSKLSIIERYGSADAGIQIQLAVTRIELGDNAQLNHCRVQNNNRDSFHIANIESAVSKDAQYVNHQFNLGGSLSRIDLNVQLNGAESFAELNGLQFADGNQVLDTHSRVEHCVPHARSAETYHGIANDRGQVVFNGKVMVHKHAIKTDAQQSSRNLLLSPKAEIDTKPELEIYADDVKCSHGATVGQLDKTALFYLRSRGIGEQEARALLTLAFADAVINRVPFTNIRDELTAMVHARFGNKMEAAQ